MKFYYGVNPAEKREKLLYSKAVKPIVDNIIDIADKVINKEQPALRMSEYMLFFQNGNRDIFEGKYLYSSIGLNKLRFQNQNTLPLIFCLRVCLMILQKAEFFRNLRISFIHAGKERENPLILRFFAIFCHD